MKSIIGHSVRVNDIGLLQFMYPEFIVIDKPVIISERPVIFTGETNYINQIKELGVPYIIVNKLAEINLTDRLTMLEVIFTKYNKNPPKYLIEPIDGKPLFEKFDDKEFLELVKMYWVTGKWQVKEYSDLGKFLILIDSFNTNTYEIVKTYLKLLEEVSSDYIETCLLSFISRIVNPSEAGSSWYKKRLKAFSDSKKALIPIAIDNYIHSNVDNNELKVFNLIFDLNKKR